MASSFTFAAAQFAPIKGDIAKNIAQHLKLIEEAHHAKVDALIFPELSLTGYELELAGSLALDLDDPRLAVLQEQADKNDMLLAVGAPIKSGSDKPYISLIIFLPETPPTVYHKMHITQEESTYCCTGAAEKCISFKGEKIGFAICADLGFLSQPKNSASLGASIYLSSVLATESWYDKDAARLKSYAATYSFPSLMANFIGHSGPYVANGKSAIWNEKGELIAQAPETGNALVIATKQQDGWVGHVTSL